MRSWVTREFADVHSISCKHRPVDLLDRVWLLSLAYCPFICCLWLFSVFALTQLETLRRYIGHHVDADLTDYAWNMLANFLQLAFGSFYSSSQEDYRFVPPPCGLHGLHLIYHACIPYGSPSRCLLDLPEQAYMLGCAPVSRAQA